MAGRERGPHFKNPDEPRQKNSRVLVVDRARIVDVYRRGGDLKQLADPLGINIKIARSIAATDRETSKHDGGSKRKFGDDVPPQPGFDPATCGSAAVEYLSHKTAAAGQGENSAWPSHIGESPLSDYTTFKEKSEKTEDEEAQDAAPQLSPSHLRGPGTTKASQHHGRHVATVPTPLSCLSHSSHNHRRHSESQNPGCCGIRSRCSSGRDSPLSSLLHRRCFSENVVLTLGATSAGQPSVAAVCVNHRRNAVATNATMPECLRKLLSITEASP
ncbi:hypothetical protein HPB51_008888 [Rhipicephalus microplus]|uniref:Uncharacterized protein n=1 Tax=Rhipicephalus microplus TaxID=6941 RepID=A0A9J6D938_RHIMP|nr:hypothetical protein HPB51_008888 [Rhipicephalus microplus]